MKGKALPWYRVDQCIWSSEVEIGGMAPLEEKYPLLEEWFVDFLGVADLTPEILINELKGRWGPQKTFSEMKQGLLKLSSLLQEAETKPDAAEFRKCSVFPVHDADGTERLCTDEAWFTIEDRKPLGEIFRDKVSFLDFTFEEVRELRHLISWLGYESRYLSAYVKETTAIGTDERIRVYRKDRQITDKAYALTR